MKYANIVIEDRYLNEGNLGDYVQFVAIENIYEKMGISKSQIIKIHYFDLMDYDGEEVILPINFFYTNPSSDSGPFVLSPKIHPVFLGLHLPGKVNDKEIEYFYSNTPIGCRDEYTYNILKKAFIDKYSMDYASIKNKLYLQGCITATLPKREEKEYDSIIFVDIPKSIEDCIPEFISKEAKKMSQLLYEDLKSSFTNEGFNNAQEYVRSRLKYYRDNSKLIVTSRMHCAVPCIAMGIPVVFIVPAMSSRFSWMEKLTRIYTYDEIKEVDWNPKPIVYDETKELILQSAISRIRGDFDIESCTRIHDWYMDRKKRNYAYDNGIELLYNYANENWSRYEKIEYILWGVTATAESVYNWIKKNYPNAKLEAVIDEFRELDFHGIKTTKSSNLEKFPHCYYIGTGASASVAMKKKLFQLGETWVERGIAIIP